MVHGSFGVFYLVYHGLERETVAFFG